MGRAVLNTVISRVRSSLRWPVSFVQGTERNLAIVTNPWERTHTIEVPDDLVDWRPIELLHELAHAYLAETVHPLLSTAYFTPGTPDVYVTPFWWPHRVTTDWYADALLMKWCPDEAREEILEHLRYALDLATKLPTPHAPDDVFYRFTGGLFYAQALKWHLWPSQKPPPGLYCEVAETLLKVDPFKPRLNTVRTLINQLAGLVTDKRVRLVNEDGIELWDVYTP